MSKPVNKALIGVFVLGGVVLVLAAVVLLGSGQFFRKTIEAVCYFEGSVGGLNVGAPVVFRGVKIGMVREIALRYDAAEASVLIPVYLEIEQSGMAKEASRDEKCREFELMIDKGLRARLEMQSFVTGQLHIGLDFYRDKPAKFMGAETCDLEIPTVPTQIQELARKLEELPLADIIRKFDATMDGLTRVVNSPEIATTLKSVSEAATETKHLVKEAKMNAGPAFVEMKEVLKDARQLIQSIDSRVGSSITQASDTAMEIQKLARYAQGMAHDIQGLVLNANAQIQPISSSAQETFVEAKQMLSQLDTRMGILTSHFEAVTRDIRTLVQNIDTQIEPIGGSIRGTLASVERTSVEATVTLKAAQQTLGAVNGIDGGDSELTFGLTQTLKEIKTAARAIRDLADTLEQQPQSPLYGKKTKPKR